MRAGVIPPGNVGGLLIEYFFQSNSRIIFPLNLCRIAGGAARSAEWVQLFADILQTPIEIPRGTELGAMGAAMCAGVAAGVFDSFADGADRMVKIAGRVEPDPEVKAIYDTKYALYRKTIEALEPVWGDYAQLRL